MAFSDLADQVLGHCTQAFGESVVHLPQSGDPQTLRAIFSTTSVELDAATGVAVESLQPNLGVRLSDFTVAPRLGDRFTVRSTTYQVKETRPDGEGGSTLLLKKT